MKRDAFDAARERAQAVTPSVLPGLDDERKRLVPIIAKLVAEGRGEVAAFLRDHYGIDE